MKIGTSGCERRVETQEAAEDKGKEVYTDTGEDQQARCQKKDSQMVYREISDTKTVRPTTRANYKRAKASSSERLTNQERERLNKIVKVLNQFTL